MAPFSWNGSEIIYSRFIRPFVLKHQKTIDEAVEKVSDEASKIADKGKDSSDLNVL